MNDKSTQKELMEWLDLKIEKNAIWLEQAGETGGAPGTDYVEKELRVCSQLKEILERWLVYEKAVERSIEALKRMRDGIKPTVTKSFVENMTNQMEQMFMQKSKREDREFFIRCEVLKDAGVETTE